MRDRNIVAPHSWQEHAHRPATAQDAASAMAQVDPARQPMPGTAIADAGMLLRRRHAQALHEPRMQHPTYAGRKAGLALQMQRSCGNRHTRRVMDPAEVGELAQRGTRGASARLPFLDRIQSAFGHHDVQHVKAHFGPEAARASRTIGAEAFTVGDHVAFVGAASLHTAAHEAAHVVQQRAGVHLKGGVGKRGDVYERHADAVADRVVRGESAEALLDGMAGGPGRVGSTQAPVQCKFGFEIETRMLVTQAPTEDPGLDSHREPNGELLGSLPRGIDLHKDHHVDLSSDMNGRVGFPRGPLVELVTNPPLDETMREADIRAHMRAMRTFAEDAQRLSGDFQTPYPLEQIPGVTGVTQQDEGNRLYVGGLVPGQHIVGYTQATFGVRTPSVPAVFEAMQKDANISSATGNEKNRNIKHMKAALERADRVMAAVEQWVRENHTGDTDSDDDLGQRADSERPLEPGWTEVIREPQILRLDRTRERRRRIGHAIPDAAPPTGWENSPEGREYVYHPVTNETLGWADEIDARAQTYYRHADKRSLSDMGARPFARTLAEKLEELAPLRGLVTLMANYLNLPFFDPRSHDINLKNAIGQLMPKSALHTVRNAMEGFSRVLVEVPAVQKIIVAEIMAGDTGSGPVDMGGTMQSIIEGSRDPFHQQLMSRGASKAINDQRVGPGDQGPAVVIENRQLQPPGGVGKGKARGDRLPPRGDGRRWQVDHLHPREWEEVAVLLYRWLREINGFTGGRQERANAITGWDELNG